MVRIHPDPPTDRRRPGWGGAVDPRRGAIAQLGERLLCKQEVTGSIPVGSTSVRGMGGIGVGGIEGAAGSIAMSMLPGVSSFEV